MIVGLYWIRKNYGITIDLFSSVKILFSSAVSSGLTYVVVTHIGFGSWFSLVVGVAVFVPLYILASLLTKTVTVADVNNLRDMTKSLGSLHRLIVLVLDFYEKLIITLKLE